MAPGIRSFGPTLDPATVTVLGGAPVRIRAQAPWQAAYNVSVGVTFQQAQTAPNARTVTLNGSFDFFGGGGWTLEVPDFTGAPGWNPDWMLRPGVSTSHTTSAIGLLAGSSPIPADGVELRTGQRIGTVTP